MGIETNEEMKLRGRPSEPTGVRIQQSFLASTISSRITFVIGGTTEWTAFNCCKSLADRSQGNRHNAILPGRLIGDSLGRLDISIHSFLSPSPKSQFDGFLRHRAIPQSVLFTHKVRTHKGAMAKHRVSS